MEKMIKRSPMIERLELKGEKGEQIRKVLAFAVHSAVATLVLLGFIGGIFAGVFLISLFLYFATGEAGLGMRYWPSALMSFFLFFFKFPRLNKFWDRYFFK
jgi:hypothetical protein